MTSLSRRTDSVRARAGTEGRAPRRAGRVSALVAGTIAVSTAGLVAAVAWPTLWWDVATSTTTPIRPISPRAAAQPRPGPPIPIPAIPDWRSEPIVKPLTDIRPPAVRSAGQRVAGTRRTAPGLAVTEIGLAGAVPVVPVPPSTVGLYSGACWAADGRSFLILSTLGELHHISYPELVRTRVADLGQIARQIVPSAAGLVVVLGPLQELWVLDPDSLGLRRRIGISGLRRVVTGPDLSVCYALASGPERGASQPFRVGLVDGTLTGLTIRVDPSMASVGIGLDFRRSILAPDGKNLFAEAGAGQVVRYRIDNDVLTLVEASNPIVRGDRGYVSISPDGEWVCLPAVDGHTGIDGGLYVYPAADLSRPAFTLRVGTGCYSVRFDPAGRRVYAHSFEQPLLLFDAAGNPGPTVSPNLFPPGQHDVIGFAPGPNGRALLVVTAESLFLVEFTDG